MKIRLGSKTLKKSLNSKEVELDRFKVINLYLIQDSNIPTIKDGDTTERDMIIMDCRNLAFNSLEIENIAFNNIPTDVISSVLKIKDPTLTLGIYDSIIDPTQLDDNLKVSKVSELRLFSITSKSGKRERFEPISKMSKLDSLSINEIPGIDVDALFLDVPNPRSVHRLIIGSETPSPEVLLRFKKVTSVLLQNIADPQKFKSILSALSLEELIELNIINCNMDGIDSSIIARLQSLKSIKLTNNTDANYNEILSDLPDKDSLISVDFASLNKEYQFSSELLKLFENLEYIRLSDLKLDLDSLHEYLLGANKLDSLTLKNNSFWDDLSFIDGIRGRTEVELDSPNVTYSALTPEIAIKHSVVKLIKDDSKGVVTLSGAPEIDGKFDIMVELDCSDLYHVSDLISKCKNIVMAKVNIPKYSNGINQVGGFLLPYAEKCVHGYQIIIEDFSRVGTEELNMLNSNNNLGKITVVDKHASDVNIPERYSYKVDKYSELEEKIKEITSDIPENLSDLQKFMIVYRRIGTRISYDRRIVGENEYSDYAKENVDDCRNLVNGLLRNTCVCAGYADILYNCLREVGINAYKINGLSGEYHQWNIVELDGNFYNTDLTWDSPALGKSKELDYCLRADAPFEKKHRKTNGFDAKCPKDYSRREIKKALDFAREFDGERLPTVWDKFKMKFFRKTKAIPEYATPQENMEKQDKVEKRPSWEISDEEKREANSQLSHISDNSNTRIEYVEDKDREE